ncbi:MAG: hypothetical protein NVS2B3_03140 [Vulcanimicrobiaceae bacterium]
MVSLAATTLALPLRGAGGEPVSFAATLGSHGLAWLPPNAIAPSERALATTLRLGDGTARDVTMHEEPPGTLAVAIAGEALAPDARTEVVRAAHAMFALDDDLAPFYARIARLRDDDLAFATAGLGRMLRSPSAFEDVVRTICTTNCTWSATQRMIGALVAHLGTAADGSGAPGDAAGPSRRAFPTAAQIATADDAVYRDVARAGYRGAYLRALGRAVAAGELDLEAMRAASRAELPDDDLERALLALPGVGPYAAAHVMMLFGRCSRLVLDSWTRPRYAELVGKRRVSDRTIERRFARYGAHAGRAFWLVLWKSRHLGDDRRV